MDTSRPPDLTAKVIIVTGANSGLGLESTKAMAAKGATVVMACRSVGKAQEAKTQVLAGNPAAKLDVMPLDNASLASVRAFADAFKAKYKRLDILLNNAGVMAICCTARCPIAPAAAIDGCWSTTIAAPKPYSPGAHPKRANIWPLPIIATSKWSPAWIPAPGKVMTTWPSRRCAQPDKAAVKHGAGSANDG